jgi:transcriptional antiterminator NusG
MSESEFERNEETSPPEMDVGGDAALVEEELVPESNVDEVVIANPDETEVQDVPVLTEELEEITGDVDAELATESSETDIEEVVEQTEESEEPLADEIPAAEVPGAVTDVEESIEEALDEPIDEERDEEESSEEELETELEERVPVMEPDDGRLWYVVHCYSGYENKVRHNLEQRIETMGMKDKIFDVVVPTEEEIEIKDGKRKTVERRVFPGYILVQMIMDEDSWYVVRNTPGVTGFVGMGNEPTPLRPEEVSQIVKRMEAEAPRIKVTYKTGQKVRIIDGPFNDFIGTVANIDMDRAKVRVMVSFFGRDTPVELDFLQVEKA